MNAATVAAVVLTNVVAPSCTSMRSGSAAAAGPRTSFARAPKVRRSGLKPSQTIAVLRNPGVASDPGSGSTPRSDAPIVR